MITARPIDLWTEPETRQRKRSTFSAPWANTVNILEREIHMLGGSRAVLQLAVTEGDLRLDGWIRASARPAHPGVIVSFESRHGPLRYSTDVFTNWQDNVRAIALGLEALRKVDRYGIARAGQQYTGWKALPTGENTTDRERGEFLIRDHGGVRQALMATHPDRGGDPRDFAAVQAAREAGAV